jgi:hypothetical protein
VTHPLYCLVRVVLDLLVLRGRRDRPKDAEIRVLRQELAMLRQSDATTPVRTVDRSFLTAISRVIGRGRWAIVLVKPDTLLR